MRTVVDTNLSPVPGIFSIRWGNVGAVFNRVPGSAIWKSRLQQAGRNIEMI